MNKRAILFLNGEPPGGALLRSIDTSDATVVCADGAYAYVRHIFRPDIVLGDFDSLEDVDGLDGTEVIRFPIDKDFTDGHLAVDMLLKRGVSQIDIYGAFGGRVAHAYANLSLLYQAKCGGAFARLLDERQDIRLLSGQIRLTGVAGTVISLEPFFSSAHIIRTKGLKYRLTDHTLNRMHALGVSNLAVQGEVEIETPDELLVCIER